MFNFLIELLCFWRQVSLSNPRYPWTFWAPLLLQCWLKSMLPQPAYYKWSLRVLILKTQIIHCCAPSKLLFLSPPLAIMSLAKLREGGGDRDGILVQRYHTCMLPCYIPRPAQANRAGQQGLHRIQSNLTFMNIQLWWARQTYSQLFRMPRGASVKTKGLGPA